MTFANGDPLSLGPVIPVAGWRGLHQEGVAAVRQAHQQHVLLPSGETGFVFFGQGFALSVKDLAVEFRANAYSKTGDTSG